MRLVTLGDRPSVSRVESPMTLLTELAIPTPLIAITVACGWNGRIYVGLTNSTPLNNLHIYDEDGNSIGAPALSGPSNAYRRPRQLRLSGDATRTISATSIVGGDNYLSFYNTP